MAFHDDDNDPVSPEYMAGYVAYGNACVTNPFPLTETDDRDWSEYTIRVRQINRRHGMWKDGNQDAMRDSSRNLQ